MTKDSKANFLTVPNLLTCLRILLVPIFLTMMLHHKSIQALIIFLIAGSTDLLDGLTARLWNQKTKLGAFLDPTADKLLATTAFITLTFPSLSSPNNIPLWLTATAVGRDIIIGSGVLILYFLIDFKQIKPTLLGKATVFCQLSVILLVLIFNYTQTSPLILEQLFYLTLALTLISGIQYIFIGFRLLTASSQA